MARELTDINLSRMFLETEKECLVGGTKSARNGNLEELRLIGK